MFPLFKSPHSFMPFSYIGVYFLNQKKPLIMLKMALYYSNTMFLSILHIQLPKRFSPLLYSIVRKRKIWELNKSMEISPTVHQNQNARLPTPYQQPQKFVRQKSNNMEGEPRGWNSMSGSDTCINLINFLGEATQQLQKFCFIIHHLIWSKK